MDDKELVRVRDIIKTRFDTLARAPETMTYVETETLIVRKRHADDTIGMVEISGISRQESARDQAPDRVDVYEIMPKPVLSVDPAIDIRHRARGFARFDLSRGPVGEDGEVLGIVSLTDLVVNGMIPDLR